MKLLILTITFCTAFLVWGTIIVVRQVTDKNYHDPAPLSKQEVYKQCMNYTAGNASDLNSACTKLAGIK